MWISHCAGLSAFLPCVFIAIFFPFHARSLWTIGNDPDVNVVKYMVEIQTVRMSVVFNGCDIGKCFFATSNVAFIVVNIITLRKGLSCAMVLTGEVERYFAVADFGKNKEYPCVMED